MQIDNNISNNYAQDMGLEGTNISSYEGSQIMEVFNAQSETQAAEKLESATKTGKKMSITGGIVLAAVGIASGIATIVTGGAAAPLALSVTLLTAEAVGAGLSSAGAAKVSDAQDDYSGVVNNLSKGSQDVLTSAGEIYNEVQASKVAEQATTSSAAGSTLMEAANMETASLS